MQPLTPFPLREGREGSKKIKSFDYRTGFCRSGLGGFPVTMQVK